MIPQPKFKEPVSSLQNALKQRKTNISTCGLGSFHYSRFYKYVYPNSAASDITAPDCLWKRFSPDGKYLVGFSKNLKQVEVYRIKKVSICSEKNKKFLDFFELVWQIELAAGSEVLSKDFCLFTKGCQFMLLASTKRPVLSNNLDFNYLHGSYPTEDIKFMLVDIKNGNVLSNRIFQSDLIHLANHKGVSLYEDFFSVVSIKYQIIYIMQILHTGKIILVKEIGEYLYDDDGLIQSAYKTNSENLSSNQSDSYNRNKRRRDHTSDASVESNEPQASNSHDGERSNRRRRIFGVFSNGSPNFQSIFQNRNLMDFISEPNISLFLQNSFGLISNRFEQIELQATSSESSLKNSHSGLKQRMYAFLFNQSLKQSDPMVAQQIFYRMIPQYDKLVVWQSQFVDRDVVLIKFGLAPHVYLRQQTSTNASANSLTMFMLFNIRTTKVLGLADSYSPYLGLNFANKYNMFYLPMSSSSLLQSNYYCGNSLENELFYKDHPKNTRNLNATNERIEKLGGITQATRRAVSSLPFQPQAYIESPYFDFDLFRLSLRSRSILERNRLSTHTLPIKFYDRLTGKLKFYLSALNLDDQTYNGGGGDNTQDLQANNDYTTSIISEGNNSNGMQNSMVSARDNLGQLRKSIGHATYLCHPFLPIFISVFYGAGIEDSVCTNIYFRR
ncbi:hypothetical protein BB561_000435 [Smittium simulii]|uniref:Uncharacterized protein n=1 Tax=Smittium simulii TaxID=133385 RepID=A0A2T9YZ62_9FUNG|nr:hypothetical protein BB561_000435 [Smittium simulii]